MSGKRLLKSVLGLTGSLNRMHEEREMWRLREMEKNAHWRDFRVHEPRTMIARGRLLSDSLSSPPPPSPSSHRSLRKQRCSPDDHAPLDDHAYREGRGREGYWTRRLLKQEENDPSRWGHSGYRELYADEFASSSDSDSEGEDTKHEPSRGASVLSAKKKKKKKVRKKGSGVVLTRKRRRGLSESTEEGEGTVRRKKNKKLKEGNGEKRKRKDRRKKGKYHKNSTADKQ